jgi:hypothetical protein
MAGIDKIQRSWLQENIIENNAGLIGSLGLLGAGVGSYFSGFALVTGISMTLAAGGICFLATRAVEKLLNFLGGIKEGMQEVKDVVHQAKVISKAIDPEKIKRIVAKIDHITEKVNDLIEHQATDGENFDEQEKPADVKEILGDLKLITQKLNDGMLDDIEDTVKRVNGALMIFRQPVAFAGAAENDVGSSRDDSKKPKPRSNH